MGAGTISVPCCSGRAVKEVVKVEGFLGSGVYRIFVEIRLGELRLLKGSILAILTGGG